MKRGFVIFSESAGVFLGAFLGLGFWSKLDAAGQFTAPVFSTIASCMRAGLPGWADESSAEV